MMSSALFLFWFLLILFLSNSLAIKWLALHRVHPAWSETGNCPRTREERKVHGLVNFQARICSQLPDHIPHIIGASQQTVDVCQWTFADRRWNCSSILSAPHLGPDLMTGTKEQAFVYALSSAAITHQVAKACSSGHLPNCPCGHGDSVTTTAIESSTKGLLQRNLTELGYKWKGCSDNLEYGIRISQDWSDAKGRANQQFKMVSEVAKRKRWNIMDPPISDLEMLKQMPNGKRNGQKARMNEYNNEIGRLITKQTLYKKCKCHGVSSSCDVKTCWYTLPPLEQIAQILKQKYDEARPMLGSAAYFVDRRRYKSSEDALVYLKQSPNYCENNPAVGSQGTRHRECNISSYGTDSCESLCCGRGVEVSQVRLEENCHCKYIHCCYIKCKKCLTTLSKYFCK